MSEADDPDDDERVPGGGLTSAQCISLIRDAVERRARFAGADFPVRLFDRGGDGIHRLVIERFGNALRASGGAEQAALLPDIRAALGDSAPLFHRFSHTSRGGPDDGARVVTERGLQFETALLPNRNTGLFLEARAARNWVRENSDGRRVLNLFSYTCAFGVAAAKGGARATTNVDAVPNVLTTGQRNYALNSLRADGRTFWCMDVLTALRKARRNGASFDGVILHPPPVPTGGVRGRRTNADSLAALTEACREVMAPGAWMLVAATATSVRAEQIDHAVGLGLPFVTLPADGDFVDSAAQPSLRARVYGAAGSP